MLRNSILLAAALAAPQLPAQLQEPLALDLHVLGAPGPTPIALPGVLGSLEVTPVLVASRAQIAAAQSLGALPPWLHLQQAMLRDQQFALGPARTARSLLDGDIELRMLLGIPGGEDTGEAVRPAACRVWLTLNATPIHANFTRWLRFRDDGDDDAFLELAFTNTSGMRWDAALPAGIGVLEDFVVTGARSHWDRVALVNRGGTTELDIHHLQIELDYETTDFLRGSSPVTITIPLVNRTLDRVLPGGTAEMPLNTYARNTRRAFAGVDGSYPQCVLDAIDDLGKSGSDGGSGENPKYGGAYELLCSEFVSWYYHHAGVAVDPLSPNEFRDITGTQQMHDLFRDAHRLYRYHSGASHQRFEDPDTGTPYTPGPGDFLEWRKNGAAMHAMMLLCYDPTEKIATVINGPWPVRLMQVDLQWWEATCASAEFDFWVGAIPR